jgi:hypothetical protein
MRLFWIALDGSVQMASISAGNHWVLRELVKAGSAHSASPLGGIAAISRIPTSAEVWYVGADGSVQDLYWYLGGQWQNFTLVEASGPPSASPTRGIAAVSRIPTSMEVWYVGSDGSVQDLYWYQSGQWPNFGGQWKNSRVPGAGGGYELCQPATDPYGTVWFTWRWQLGVRLSVRFPVTHSFQRSGSSKYRA